MKITKASYRGGQLVLDTPDTATAGRFVYEFKEGDYEISLRRKKRSIDANAYAWVLIDKLAEKLGIAKEEIYRNAIREIGGVSDVLCLQNKSVNAFCKQWANKGVGWQTQTEPSKIQGCTNVIVYYGSSTYDVKQMSALLKSLQEDCREQGIETKTPDEVQKLLALYQSGGDSDECERESS